MQPKRPAGPNGAANSARLRPTVGIAIRRTMGAEDFAYYAKEVPAMFFFVGATPAGQDPAKAPSNHSPKFFLDESALPLGTRAMLQVALDYLVGPSAP